MRTYKINEKIKITNFSTNKMLAFKTIQLDHGLFMIYESKQPQIWLKHSYTSRLVFYSAVDLCKYKNKLTTNDHLQMRNIHYRCIKR